MPGSSIGQSLSKIQESGLFTILLHCKVKVHVLDCSQIPDSDDNFIFHLLDYDFTSTLLKKRS